jgi:hypothetical protein
MINLYLQFLLFFNLDVLLECLLEAISIFTMKVVFLARGFGNSGLALAWVWECRWHSWTCIPLLMRFSGRGVVHGLAEGGGFAKGDEGTLGLSLSTDWIEVYFVIVVVTVVENFGFEGDAFFATASKVRDDPCLLHVGLGEVFWELVKC